MWSGLLDIALFLGCAIILGAFFLSLRRVAHSAQAQRDLEMGLMRDEKQPDDLLR